MRQKIRDVKNRIIENILWILPKKTAANIAYYRRFRTRLNLKHPEIFNEKLQYMMLFCFDQKISNCADKYAVRRFLKAMGYEYLLTKLYGVYEDANEIDYSVLPNKFVLKTNNGCHMNILCRDKMTLNIKEINFTLNKWLKVNYAKKYLEYHYADIHPCIICEELLETEAEDIIDYKIHCFHGKPVGILVCTERSQSLRLNWYDLEWTERKNYIKEEYQGNVHIKRPQSLEQMIKIATDISKDFAFIRVDLYEVEGRIVFSELTFTPEAGRIDYFTYKVQKDFGKKIKLGK